MLNYHREKLCASDWLNISTCAAQRKLRAQAAGDLRLAYRESVTMEAAYDRGFALWPIPQ